MTKAEELEQLRRQCEICQLCDIGGCMIDGKYLSNVLSNMHSEAEIMVVGQNPGLTEIKERIPFMGAAGHFFNKAIKEVLGVDRSVFYVSNACRCLRYNQHVYLENGERRWISHLVRERYKGRVLSVSPNGALEYKRIIGWHKSLVAGRKWVKLSYELAKGNAKGKVGPTLTEDHLVLTTRGYIAVGKIRPTDTIAIGEPAPNEVLSDIITGSMLGDAGIPSRCAYFVEGHSREQKEYLLFKKRCLRRFSPRLDEYTVVSKGKEEHKVRLSTGSCRFFKEMREKFYSGGAKNVWSIKRFSPLLIAVWYMDDGFLASHKQNPRMGFSTQGFTKKEVDHLVDLFHAFGIKDVKRVRSNGWIITVGTEGTARLMPLIAPFILPSMRYKVHSTYQDVEYDNVESDCGVVNYWAHNPQIEERSYPDKSAYCIDVEDNHNFVTNGGVVVHNCYTPGNRSPYADELENCRYYLDEEVRILQPKLIITLGNPALKAMTGMNGIWKHHGKLLVSLRYKVKVLPLFHPSPINTNKEWARNAIYEDLAVAKEFL